MVALIAFVVVAEHARAGNHVRESVLETMRRRQHGMRHAPDLYFGKCIRRQDDSGTAIMLERIPTCTSVVN